MQNQVVIVIDSNSSDDDNELELERDDGHADDSVRVPNRMENWHMHGGDARMAALAVYKAYHPPNATTTNSTTTTPAAAAATTAAAAANTTTAAETAKYATTATANEEDNEELDVPDDMKCLICPISHKVMRKPVICADGNTYEKEFIQHFVV